MTMPDLQRYPYKLGLIKYDFLCLKTIYFDFLFTRKNDEIIRIKHLFSQKNVIVFHIFDQIKFSRVLL